MSSVTACRFAVGTILVMTLSSEPTRACVEVFPKQQVGADFVVSVRGLGGQHLEGVRVTIYDLNHLDLDQKSDTGHVATAEALTDKHGRAAFHGFKYGRYIMGTEHGEIAGDTTNLDVNSSGGTTVNAKWPSDRVFKVQTVAGTLMRAGIPGVPKMDKDTILAAVNLSLTEAFSGREIGKTSTDKQGNFAFPVVVRGLYAMHINWGEEGGYILLEVTTEAKDGSSSRFFINPTDCGLGAYKE